MAGRILMACLLGALLASCAVPGMGSCNQGAMSAYADAAGAQLRQFEQQAALVAAAPRIGLAEPLQRLLDIQTATRAVEAPECVADFHARLVGVMEAEQNTYQQFAAQTLDAAAAGAQLREHQAARAELATLLDTIRAGTVPPLPAPTAAPEPVTPPESATVSKTMLLMSAPAGAGSYEVCPGDLLSINARVTEGGSDWVRVIVLTNEGAAGCTGVLPQAPIATSGWLPDSEVSAP
jgi:hypothetical protein